MSNLRVSRVLKAATAVAVMGVAGLAMAPAAHASMITFELVPTSATSGTVNGQSVSLTGPGTVSFNILAVLHNGTDLTADVGLQQAGLTVLSDSGGSLGTLNLTNPTSSPSDPGSPFNNSLNYPGTPSGNPIGTDVGPDKPGVPNSDNVDQYFIGTSNNLPVKGTPNASGDLTQQIGTGTFAVTATSGSTTVIPVIHLDTATVGPARLMYHFIEQNVTYNLNGTGAGTANGAATTVSNPFDTQGFSVALTPEPGSLALAGLGGLGLLLRRRRK